MLRHILGIQNFSIFCENDYKLSTCQVSNSSVIWIKFYRSWYKTPPKTLWCHHDVTSQLLVFKIAHFVELNKSCLVAKVHWPSFSGSNFMRAGGKHFSSDLHALKKPSPYWVKLIVILLVNCYITNLILPH